MPATRCGNCGGGYFEGISGGMMSGPMCKCGNRSTSAAPRRAQTQRTNNSISAGMYPNGRGTNTASSRAQNQSTHNSISAGMYPQSFQAQRSYQQQRVQGQPLSTTTDSVPFGLGIALGLVLGVVLCLGFAFIF
jgi:predicted  nucleic acid-binding Zn-ribbon protein